MIDYLPPLARQIPILIKLYSKAPRYRYGLQKDQNYIPDLTCLHQIATVTLNLSSQGLALTLYYLIEYDNASL